MPFILHMISYLIPSFNPPLSISLRLGQPTKHREAASIESYPLPVVYGSSARGDNDSTKYRRCRSH